MRATTPIDPLVMYHLGRNEALIGTAAVILFAVLIIFWGDLHGWRGGIVAALGILFTAEYWVLHRESVRILKSLIL